MPTVVLSPIGGAGEQFFDNSGNVLSGGLLYTYAAGTTTPLATYTSLAGTVANTNPVVLNSAGRSANEVWLIYGASYKFVLKTSTGSTIWTQDNISGSSAAGGLQTAASIVVLKAMTGMTTGARVLVQDIGFFRYDSTSSTTAVGSLIVTPDSGTGRWFLEVDGENWRPSYDAVQYGMVATLTDATTMANNKTALQAAIDAAYAAGGGVVNILPGTYNINGGTLMKPGVSVFGYGATLKIPALSADFTRILTSQVDTWESATDSPVTTIAGITFDGNRVNQGPYTSSQLEHQAGIFAMCSDSDTAGRFRLVVRDVVCKEWAGDGIALYKNVDVQIANVRTDNCWRTGLSLTGGHSILQVVNYLDGGGTYQGGFDIEVDAEGYNQGAYLGLGYNVDVNISNMQLAANFDISLEDGARLVGDNIVCLAPFFSFSAIDSYARISNSIFAVGEHSSSGNRIVFPGNSTFENCRFIAYFADSPSANHEVVRVLWTSGGVAPTNQRLSLIGCTIVHPEIAWAASTAYRLGQEATNGGNLYRVITAGTSDSSGGPTGTGSDITDGAGPTPVHWTYLRAAASGTNKGVYIETDQYTNGNRCFIRDCTVVGPFTTGVELNRGGILYIHDTVVDGATTGYTLNHLSTTNNYRAYLDNARMENGTTWLSLSSQANNQVFFNNIRLPQAQSLTTATGTNATLRYGNREIMVDADPAVAGNIPGLHGDIAVLVHQNPPPPDGTILSWLATVSSTSNALWKTQDQVPMFGSKTYDPASIAAGATLTTTVTVTGCVLGDMTRGAFTNSLAGLVMTTYVQSAGVVGFVFYNPTAGAVDLASGTLSAQAFKT